MVDLADQKCRYGFIEQAFDRLTAKHGVAGYRIDPVVAGVSS
jgi:hypothetical protein